MPLENFLSGSFEANPPFQEEHMLLMALRFHQALLRSQEPLSFLVIVPGWTDAASFNLLRDSSFNRFSPEKYLKLQRHQHAYTDGAQHRTPNLLRISAADSFVFLLQNDAGAVKWPVPLNFPDRLARAFRLPSQGARPYS